MLLIGKCPLYQCSVQNFPKIICRAIDASVKWSLHVQNRITEQTVKIIRLQEAVQPKIRTVRSLPEKWNSCSNLDWDEGVFLIFIYSLRRIWMSPTKLLEQFQQNWCGNSIPNSDELLWFCLIYVILSATWLRPTSALAMHCGLRRMVTVLLIQNDQSWIQQFANNALLRYGRSNMDSSNGCNLDSFHCSCSPRPRPKQAFTDSIKATDGNPILRNVDIIHFSGNERTHRIEWAWRNDTETSLWQTFHSQIPW
jgi:hypothetical protein